MSQTNCLCTEPSINVPVIGIELKLAESAFSNIGGTGGINYSFEEQWTGTRWIDGKKIYQKTLALGPIPATPTTQSTPMGVTNIDTVIDLWGIAKKDHSAFLCLPRVATGLAGMIECYVEQTNPDNPCLIMITMSEGGGYLPVKESFVTVQYTCTDR